MRLSCLGAAALLVLAACGGDDRAPADTIADTTAVPASAAADERATKAATVANAIRANPAAADSILAANGWTRESFEALIYDIAADSALSATYAAAHAP